MTASNWSAAFRKVTGVDMNADTAALEKGLAAAVRKTTASEIATALLVRELVARGWKVTESAEKVGLAQSAASLAGARGAILWETGPESIEIVWANVKALPAKALTDLGDTLRAMTTVKDRADYVIRLGQRKVATDRLGTNGTPERIDALTDSLLSDGHRTPVTGRKAAAGVAERLGIPLPKVERKGAAGKATERKADIPTFDAAALAFLAACEQAHNGADDDHPVELTPEQAALLDKVIAAAVALSEIAKVHVPA